MWAGKLPLVFFQAWAVEGQAHLWGIQQVILGSIFPSTFGTAQSLRRQRGWWSRDDPNATSVHTAAAPLTHLLLRVLGFLHPAAASWRQFGGIIPSVSGAYRSIRSRTNPAVQPAAASSIKPFSEVKGNFAVSGMLTRPVFPECSWLTSPPPLSHPRQVRSANMSDWRPANRRWHRVFPVMNRRPADPLPPSFSTSEEQPAFHMAPAHPCLSPRGPLMWQRHRSRGRGLPPAVPLGRPPALPPGSTGIDPSSDAGSQGSVSRSTWLAPTITDPCRDRSW